MIATINPATGETLRTFESLSDEQLEAKLQQASTTFASYRLTSFAERAPLMLRAAEILEAEKHELGRLMTIEMGKPIKSAVQEAEKCAWGCRDHGENAAGQRADQGSGANTT